MTTDSGVPWRDRLIAYIRENAKPVDKFSHQARLYSLAIELANDQAADDDVVFAAAWLHDLGVFVGHRPEDPDQLAKWDHVEYVMRVGPGVLRECGFSEPKISAVLEAVKAHLPASEPQTIEGIVLRDADILEQLGAVGVLRIVSKVGRDTRYTCFDDALRTLQRNVERLPGQIRLERAKFLAEARVSVLRDFLEAAKKESNGLEW